MSGGKSGHIEFLRILEGDEFFSCDAIVSKTRRKDLPELIKCCAQTLPTNHTPQ